MSIDESAEEKNINDSRSDMTLRDFVNKKRKKN